MNDSIKQIYQLCVKGDVLETINTLKSLNTEAEKAVAVKYIERFFSDGPTFPLPKKDRWIDEVLTCYYMYFIDVLTKRREQESAETRLFTNLQRFFPQLTTIDQLETALAEVFRMKGYFFQGGKTLPHYGPYIWKAIDKQVYQVELPDASQLVTVHFMKDFIMLSWLSFATFGHLYAGGWAKEDGLYCVWDAYKDKLDSNAFQIAYLKHEAQHYYDYQQYPKLDTMDLEYRAKLVELIYYPNYERLRNFTIQANDDPNNPHAYVSFLIIKQFSQHFFKREFEKDMEKWQRITIDRLQQFAKLLYERNTEQLTEAGPTKVRSVILE